MTGGASNAVFKFHTASIATFHVAFQAASLHRGTRSPPADHHTGRPGDSVRAIVSGIYWDQNFARLPRAEHTAHLRARRSKPKKSGFDQRVFGWPNRRRFRK